MIEPTLKLGRIDGLGPEVRLRAFVLFMDGASYDQIAQALGVSSRVVAIWSKDGEVTEGVRWMEFRDGVEPLRAVVQGGMSAKARAVARRIERMELDLDQLMQRAVEELHNKANAGKLNPRIDDVAKLARARMQIQEFYQREVIAMRKVQERLVEALLRYKNEIGHDLLFRISEDLDRLLEEAVESAGGDPEKIEPVAQTALLVAQ